MKIAFVNNAINHHQKPFSDAMFEKFGDEYWYICVKQMTQERKAMGWELDNAPVYVHNMFDSEEIRQECERYIDDADVVVIGSAPDSLIVNRLKKRKLTFKYAERFYKQGINLKNVFRIIGGTWLHHGRFQKYKLNMLCASAYTAQDCRLFHNYTGRMYKWGYFPPMIPYDVETLMKLKHPVSILWVARFIEWKHPELAIDVARRLKAENIPFHMTMVGDGNLKEKIDALVKEYSLNEEVTLTGNINPNEVRNLMEKASVFLFTSDKNEGWGAVLNEAMNSGCAVVACRAIGSAPYLIKEGINGEMYNEGDVDTLYQKTKVLVTDSALAKKLGIAAYKTISDEWNANEAADRFVSLCDAIQNSKPDLYPYGPCSKA